MTGLRVNKSKSKPQWAIISHPLGWLLSKVSVKEDNGQIEI